MEIRRSDYDVTNQVKTTDPDEVNQAVRYIYLELYPNASPKLLNQSFADIASMYEGETPGYIQCDTAYHDVQHILDVTLAMARLMDGYERHRNGAERLDAKLFRLGVIVALFHDCGYFRHKKDSRHKNGSEYTINHVSRGAKFMQSYLPKMGMEDLGPEAMRIVHFTGYEIPPEKVRVYKPILRLVGYFLGTADIIAQMADRCYLEKCRDRLYPEFVLGGIARKRVNGREEIIFASAADLVAKTPGFYRGAAKRLNEKLGGVHHYAERHFGGQNLYLEEIEKNIGYAEAISEDGDMSRLRRTPPETKAMELFPRGII